MSLLAKEVKREVFNDLGQASFKKEPLLLLVTIMNIDRSEARMNPATKILHQNS